MVLTQFGISIKVVHLDNGCQYFKIEVTEFMHSIDILHQTSCSISKQNRVAEHKTDFEGG